MKRNKTMIAAACVLAAMTIVAGCSRHDSHAGAAGHTATMDGAPVPDIVDTAVAAGSFNTLVTAVKAAGLVDTLKSPGPFTVFAPTDEAFAKLPAGTLSALLADKEKLTAVLLYHVVPGRVMAADVVKMSSAATAGGKEVPIKLDNAKAYVGQAKIVKTDIKAANGVIHVIDAVLIPPAD